MTMINGLVSVITPCFNGERFLKETIESVIRQNYENWELIVIDDGSTDRTAEITGKYGERDTRIKYLYQENAGSAAARNRGIRAAEGQYIALLDHDDIWHEDFLEKQIDFMKRNYAACVCSSYERINEHSEPVGRVTMAKPRITLKDMKIRNYVGCLTGLYDCSVSGKVYLREELKSLRDDYAYWVDIVKLTGVILGNEEVLAGYRTYSNSYTGNKKALVAKQYRFYREYLQLSVIKSVSNIVVWGMAGILKFL